MRTQIENEIIELKKKRNAVILAHFYEDGDIQDIADEVGDSLFLAQKGETAAADVILLAGVVFMAESVKILSPKKTVLVPDMNAGCSLVAGSPYDRYLAWRNQYPDHLAVTYVNSSAAVKSISDVVCTSSNSEKIIAAIPKERGILFGPDKQLGKWLAKRTGRDMKFWEGACEVHILFSAQQLYNLRMQHPDAMVLAHPECDDGVLSQSDIVGATSTILAAAIKSPAKKFIIATEDGIFHQIKKARPDVELIQAPVASGACNCNQCPYMKLNNLEKIRNALRDMKPIVDVPAQFIDKARIGLERMMKITRGEAVTWPESFES